MKENEKAALGAARNGQLQNEEITLSTGYRVIIRPVSQLTMHEAASSILYPDVPVIITDDGREIENPDHPEYQKAVEETDTKRNLAAIDAMIALGLEVLGGPEEIDSDSWVNRLRFLERRGLFAGLSEFDLTEPLDREFVFKKYIVLGNQDDFAIISSRVSGLSKEEVLKAMASFRGD